MTERNRCSNGSCWCNFDSSIRRVEELMQAVGNHNEARPCPMCLRDSMLAAAALLHLEAFQITTSRSDNGNMAEVLADMFASAASSKLREVMEISVPSVGQAIQ